MRVKDLILKGNYHECYPQGMDGKQLRYQDLIAN